MGEPLRADLAKGRLPRQVRDPQRIDHACPSRQADGFHHRRFGAGIFDVDIDQLFDVLGIAGLGIQFVHQAQDQVLATPDNLLGIGGIDTRHNHRLGGRVRTWG